MTATGVYVLSALVKCFLPLFLPAFTDFNLYRAAADNYQTDTDGAAQTDCPCLSFWYVLMSMFTFLARKMQVKYGVASLQPAPLHRCHTRG